MENFNVDDFDKEFQKNREDYWTDPVAAHEKQVELVKSLDAATGKTSIYHSDTGIWELSDGRRSDKMGLGTVGNSTLRPTYNYKDSEIYGEYEALEDEYKNAEFIYDHKNDESYKRYKAERERSGKKAMEDTLGKIASQTGGIAGSYAVSAASGAYNDYMEDAVSKIDDFENMAYSRFRDGQEDTLSKMGLVQTEMDKEEELWAEEKAAMEKANSEKAEYIVMLQDFTENGWDSLTEEQKILASSNGGWYDMNTGILYDAAGNSYTSSYDPIKSAIARYKTKGVKGLSEKDVAYLEYEGYKIRDGKLYDPNWRAV